MGTLYGSCWGKLVRRLALKFGRKYLPDIEDAVSDSFTKLLEGLLTGQLVIWARGAFWYLFKMAQHRYAEIRAASKGTVPLDYLPEEILPAPTPTPLDETIDNDLKARIRAWIRRKLTPQQAKVALMQLEGVNYREIAARLGITFQAIKVNRSRGMKTMRKHKKEIQELAS